MRELEADDDSGVDVVAVAAAVLALDDDDDAGVVKASAADFAVSLVAASA